MNVIYCADDNYARHAGISMMSLFEKNEGMDEITVYMISVSMSKENQKILEDLAGKYNRKIVFIEFEEYKDRLVLDNGDNEHPISAYARIFVDELLPKDVEKILYLDCDILINDSLEELWNTDMKGRAVASVQDICYTVFRDETGIKEPYRYFCSGVILMDMVEWRKQDCQRKLIEYTESMKGVVKHHDQTILNGVFGQDYIVLHPRYDVLTPLFLMRYKNLIAYYKCGEDFYTKKEIKEAVKNPAIIHFTQSQIGRPWENDAHPLSHLYRELQERSPWKGYPMGEFKPVLNELEDRVYKMYQKVPVELIRLRGAIKKFLKK